MPALDLDEIPRCAGQYFCSVGVNGNIIFNANPPDTFQIHARFNRDYVSRLQGPLLPPRHPGILVHFQPESMARAVNKKMVEVVPRQDLPRCPIDIPAGRASLGRRDRRRLGLQNRLVPAPDALWGPPQVHRAGNVAAIVAEYSTQVQHDQLIFPQSFGRGARVRQGGSFSKCNNRFKGRSRRAFFSHLIFDLCSHLKFPNSWFQQTNRLFDHLTRQDGRPSHLDRKSTRLNSSHTVISYAVFCLKKKKLTISSFIICTYITYVFYNVIIT